MTARTELAGQLGGIAVVDRLTDEECALVVELIHQARRTRLKAMLAAIDEALAHLPRVLRVPARKILLG